jgi:hypothetical protein
MPADENALSASNKEGGIVSRAFFSENRKYFKTLDFLLARTDIYKRVYFVIQKL